MLATALLPVAARIAGRAVAPAGAVRLQHLLEQRRTRARDHGGHADLLRLLVAATDAVALGVIDERLLLDGALAAAARRDLVGGGTHLMS